LKDVATLDKKLISHLMPVTAKLAGSASNEILAPSIEL
jgi:hypothetical protein